ncbi:MAG: YeeE/YedE family protein [Hoeflea sp.]|nr:YeeE/YedE family protein [Hoeflea sp.]
MQKFIASALIGAIFGLGIAISGMANPAKVLNFFDVAGSWDPSLIFVMGGALITTAIGYLVIFGARQKPVFDADFHLPINKTIDARLIGGSAVFGIGWGIAGFCPGGAIPALGFGGLPVIAFVGAMIIGIVLARSIDGLRHKPAKAF